MSRIGKKPITLPKGVKYTVHSNIVVVEGPKGKVDALIPEGITFSEKDGVLTVERPDQAHAAVHGLARALVFNAVEGVTNGWKKELDVRILQQVRLSHPVGSQNQSHLPPLSHAYFCQEIPS